MSEPLVGVSCDVRVPRGRPEAWELLLDHRYAEAVKDAGGYPVILPIERRPAVIRRYLDGLDGLLIVGGEDVDPCLYGEAPKPGTGKMFAPRLAFEKRLYSAARRHGLPVLVEAIENDDETILAVQWHPERTLRSPASQKLFRAFVRLCARRCGGAAETP